MKIVNELHKYVPQLSLASKVEIDGTTVRINRQSEDSYHTKDEGDGGVKVAGLLTAVKFI